MTIDGRTLYATLLQLKAPWEITDVEMMQPPREVAIRVALPQDTLWVCPRCGSATPSHDHQERRSRHLDTCRFPRIIRLGPDGIMKRAVARRLDRRQLEAPRHAGVDESNFQERHEYVTVVSDLRPSVLVHVARDRSRGALDGFWTHLTPEQREQVEARAMDMSAPYIQPRREHLPEADKSIVSDRFHAAQHLGNAVDLVRPPVHRARVAEANPIHKGTKYRCVEDPKRRDWSEARLQPAVRDRDPRGARMDDPLRRTRPLPRVHVDELMIPAAPSSEGPVS